MHDQIIIWVKDKNFKDWYNTNHLSKLDNWLKLLKYRRKEYLDFREKSGGHGGWNKNWRRKRKVNKWRQKPFLITIYFQELSPSWKMSYCQKTEVVPWLLIVWESRKIDLVHSNYVFNIIVKVQVMGCLVFFLFVFFFDDWTFPSVTNQ